MQSERSFVRELFTWIQSKGGELKLKGISDSVDKMDEFFEWKKDFEKSREGKL